MQSFSYSRQPFSGSLETKDIPQFITITFDDAVTPLVTTLFNQITDLRDKRGCGIKATFFVSIQGNTKCELVQGLRKGQHEIATHTLNHLGKPSAEEIMGAVEYLSDVCGVPLDEMTGFRTPYLDTSTETMDSLSSLGFEYDSTLVPFELPEESEFGKNNLWPFTIEQTNLDQFDCQFCGGLNPHPGFVEIPMLSLINDDGSRSVTMDYVTTDVVSLLQANFEQRYNGNRAPLGLFFHASWLSANGAGFRNWLENMLETYEDVYFVTNQELLEWMRNPVPEQEYRETRSCEGQVMDCLPLDSIGCVQGIFNADTCSCDCNPPFCRDQNGLCTQVVGCPASPGADPSVQPPTRVPTVQPPSDLGPGCCSIDFKSCNAGWCGQDEESCNACGSAGESFIWLSDGPITDSCFANWGDCSSDRNGCCPGLECVGNEWSGSCNAIKDDIMAEAVQSPTTPGAPGGLPTKMPSSANAIPTSRPTDYVFTLRPEYYSERSGSASRCHFLLHSFLITLFNLILLVGGQCWA